MNKHVNAIVVGAGAGGGAVAKELAVAGLSVIILERGKWQIYDDLAFDELGSQRVQVLHASYGPDWERNPRVVKFSDGKKHTGRVADDGMGSCVGAGTVTYGAMAWRFMPEDFRLKSTYGEVEGSSLEDWPITYDDLEPYYTKAEWEVGVSGDETNPFMGRRSKPYPMPAFEQNREGQILFDTCKRMGLHPFPIPMLRNSIAYNSRAACIRNHTCCGYACPVNAKNGSQNSVIPVAIKTGNCEVKTSCIAAEVMVDDNGRATGVKYFDENNKLQTQTSDLVVVACSAVETARLLLNSKSKLHPNGAGNNNDCVGRNLQAHAYVGATGLFDYDILDLTGPGATMAICDYNNHNEGIIGGGLLANEFFMMPYVFSRSHPKGARWGKEHKDFQRDNYRRIGRMMGPIQEIPMYDSRVTIDEEVKDFWGIPVACLSGHRSPLDIESARFLATKAEEIIKEAGAVSTSKWFPGNVGDTPSCGSHQAGTCRMGNDPKTSVVNAHCQVHEIENLFIAGGSTHVTNGGFNPVLTIMATSFRTGEYIAKNFNSIKKSSL